MIKLFGRGGPSLRDRLEAAQIGIVETPKLDAEELAEPGDDLVMTRRRYVAELESQLDDARRQLAEVKDELELARSQLPRSPGQAGGVADNLRAANQRLRAELRTQANRANRAEAGVAAAEVRIAGLELTCQTLAQAYTGQPRPDVVVVDGEQMLVPWPGTDSSSSRS